MGSKTYSIGELARLSGTPVRRIRFYSDRGLLPPSARTSSNYRLYTDVDILRLDLIRTLRAAGVNLYFISKVITKNLPLADVLNARLGALEREIFAGLRIAAAIRATLSLPNPTEGDLGRILKMIAVSNMEMNNKIKEFVDRISDGTTLNERNRNRLLNWYLCDLPENPSNKQLEIWHNIFMHLDNKNVVKALNISLRRIYNNRITIEDYNEKFNDIMNPIDDAWRNGVLADSIYAKEIVRRKIHLDAMTWQAREEDVIQEYFLEFEYGVLGRELQDLCSMMRGEVLPDRSSQRSREFWNWLHEVVIAIHNDETKG